MTDTADITDNFILVLLYAVPSLINFILSVYVLFFMPPSKINRIFSLLVFLLSILQISDGFVHISNSPETALIWSKIKNSVSLFIPPFGLLFALKFTGWYKKISPSWLFTALFLPAILLHLVMAAGLDRYAVVKSEHFNWIINPQPVPATVFIYIWMVGLSALAIFSFWMFYFTAQANQKKKRQAFLLAVGMTVPFAGGVIAGVAFPLLFEMNSVPVTTPLLTFFPVFAFIAIKKYSMMEYSSRHQWQSIVQKMKEGIMITDNRDQVMYSNKAFCKLMECDGKEIQGMTAKNLFAEGDQYEKYFLQLGGTATEEEDNDRKFQLKTKSGKMKWVMLNGSAYLDRKGQKIGSIGIYTDITLLVKNEQKIRNFAAHLNKVLEDERASIAREIHDEVGQQLAGIKMSISQFKKLENVSTVEAKANAVMLDVDTAIQSLRKIATQLRPGILDTLGLVPSLVWLGIEFQKRTHITCSHLMGVTQQKFEKKISTCFFRICQEALTNVSKHSGAGRVCIEMKEEKNYLTLRITDDGKGIGSEKLANPFSLGLYGMQERANIIGAQLKITDSLQGKGTTVEIRVNLKDRLEGQDQLQEPNEINSSALSAENTL